MPPAERRQLIVGAAVTLIAARGYWKLSMQEVADASGVSVGGLFHHFPTKEALLVAVLEHRDEMDRQALHRLLALPQRASVETLRAHGVTLRRLVDAIVERNSGQREIVRLYAVLETESLAPEHPGHDFFSRRQTDVLDMLAKIAPVDGARALELARHILALLDGLQVQWMHDPAMDLVGSWRAAASEIPVLASSQGDTI